MHNISQAQQYTVKQQHINYTQHNDIQSHAAQHYMHVCVGRETGRKAEREAEREAGRGARIEWQEKGQGKRDKRRARGWHTTHNIISMLLFRSLSRPI